MKEGSLLYIGRHGKTQWNTEKRMQGRQDSPLTQEGIGHAQALARQLDGKVTKLLVSPLGRAQHTAEIVADRISVAVKTVAAFSEMDFGVFEGKREVDMRELHPEFYETREQSLEDKLVTRYPGGENYVDVHKRILQPIQELLEEHPDGGIAVIGHESVNRMIRGELRSLPPVEATALRQKNNELIVVNFKTKSETIHTL